MFEEMLKEFFESTKTVDDLFEEVFENKVNTDNVKDDNNHSYYHSVKDKYANGEHISHSEKEIKDGKVIKDVDNSFELENKKNCQCNDNVCQCDKKLYEKKETLEQSLRSAEKALVEKDRKITELESKLAEVTLDKEYLLKKFEQVKNVFQN